MHFRLNKNKFEISSYVYFIKIRLIKLSSTVLCELSRDKV